MTDNLPPLPSPKIHACRCGVVHADFDGESMENYARAAIAQAQICVPAGYVLVPVELLKRAESSLGSFCSDHGWGDADMQAMDDISGLLAASPQPQPVQPTTGIVGYVPVSAIEDVPLDGYLPVYAQAKPEQAAQPHPLSGEQASVMASYFNVPAELVHAVYNRAHGIAAPKPKD